MNIKKNLCKASCLYLFKLVLICGSLTAIVLSCKSDTTVENSKNKTEPTIMASIPEFDKDSAYSYIERQVSFGPRVPNTEAHQMCAEYLLNRLGEFSDTAFIQNFKTRAFDGTVLNGKNIIGSFQPEKLNRILLCAHWDSRPFADYDSNPDHHREPILGANDGGSGVGILLEIARQLALSKSKIGVDIIFFDLEDYGPPQDLMMHNGDHWGLGSQYWSKNPHLPGYQSRYGILLDMVGAKDARFYMEGYSMEYASGIIKKVWKTAHRLGFNDYFIYEQAGYIDDDHKYVNQIIGIPTINIIHLDPESINSSFFDHWHTMGDTMEHIDKTTLKIVGQTLLTVIFEEN
jgi:Zn-dependent M28 family amino/carboxypeptidase